ncbi:Piso0_001645 [Millerozyma farinosa CBS 7064]|uniref:Anthranilate phosphoribosyltransferase n=1 Tax=Pichia sorbitophila (strain ATCC MYA-4447 / BCRC 22081 / CBS 7064 / NBRC 10061 / NRRL Y-12695) TaxID=559304 RepID=G8YLC2_PICSO|nr:Piso0_001645 [Millerozyma farinosa CBS 7064]
MSASNKNILTPYIKSLFLEPPNLTPTDLATVLKCIFKRIPTDIQVAAFLTALRMKGLDHEPEYIAAAVSTILEFSNAIPRELVDANGYIDIVGTGGDGQNTFNVSTSSAIIAAGMGLPVCKHGGKASTSTSGSGDLLGCLGVDLSKVNNLNVPEIVKRSNFCFLFAPTFHPGMAHVAEVRSQLGVPSIFNILGPLINPMPLRARILGVYSERLGERYAKAASKLNEEGDATKTMVVFGEIGLDEVSPQGTTKCWMVERDGTINVQYISPKDFNLPEHTISEVKSGTPAENATTLYHILCQDKEEFKISDNKDVPNHPIVDYILLNTAALAVVAGIADNWADGVEKAKAAITNGAALKSLEDFKNAIGAFQ